MSSTLKDIGMGLSIGMLIGALIFGGIFLLAEENPFQTRPAPAAAQEASLPTETLLPPTPTSTSLPPQALTPTPTLIPRATTTSLQSAVPLKSQPTAPPPTPTLNVENLILHNPLTNAQQAQLHAASLLYISLDDYNTIQIGDAINGEGYGHPSNICGPLAISILQDGLILSNSIDPYDFWLINPDVKADQLFLAEVFPKSRFKSIRNKTALNKIDWAANPLLPGDFLYLFSGSRGNFEHMLVVSRVDAAGRAYSVTNYNTEEGFVIDEVLLYDPNNSGEGVFYEWTARSKAELGSTGFEGFQLWRLKE